MDFAITINTVMVFNPHLFQQQLSKLKSLDEYQDALKFLEMQLLVIDNISSAYVDRKKLLADTNGILFFLRGQIKNMSQN